MSLELCTTTNHADLAQAMGRRQRDALNMLRIDWPQGIDFLQRARGYFGDGLIDQHQRRSIVLIEAERALQSYRTDMMGWDDRARMEAFVHTVLSGLTERVAGLMVEAPGEVWQPGQRESLPEFQLRTQPDGEQSDSHPSLVVTRSNTVDPQTLAAALGPRLLPRSLRTALRWSCETTAASATGGHR